ncbi:hypothetical protein [Rugosimonospora africana]|uniref:DUF2867 domain-containing protein n=1 Tax=Rugosimonospora africana TaxID=556532 RepID=A0A8J3QLX8_9ACTN|nr:hypothetical protein [Rugosimonospora africana]GIH12467.1 hypothetical protein Raf01_06390 [Rugosimonospora africana]
MTADLPFIDEHQVLVPAPAPAVWLSLTRQLTPARLDGSRALAYLLATDPRSVTGTPLDEGSTLPGFAVSEAVPERLVRLTGHHRFSRYELVFSLTTQLDGTLLSARSYAKFPGLHGWAYRQLVIGSGAHRVIVPRMLRAVRARATRGGVDREATASGEAINP